MSPRPCGRGHDPASGLAGGPAGGEAGRIEIVSTRFDHEEVVMRHAKCSLTVCAAGAVLLCSLPAAAQVTGCRAHLPLYLQGRFEVQYTPGCTGHDEPEIDPLSSAPGSASNLTWTVVLPGDGAFSTTQVGPTFWFGGPVTDPKSLGGQAFLEVQFYPEQRVSACGSDGSFTTTFAHGVYTACSPVWEVISLPNNHFIEQAAFNAMLTDSAAPTRPLIMRAGDTVTVHLFTTPEADGWHVTVTDVTRGHSGTIVLRSRRDGPLNPVFDTQELGNSLAWGGVFDAPAAFVWEIGHDFLTGNSCNPGQRTCWSYSPRAWGNIAPIQIKGVTFDDGSEAQHWAVVSNQGGKAEVLAHCKSYGAGGFCIYPWYSRGASGFHFGVDYPDNLNDYGQADQFETTAMCGGPFGPNSTVFATTVE
jgi:hypothetical protein